MLFILRLHVTRPPLTLYLLTIPIFTAPLRHLVKLNNLFERSIRTQLGACLLVTRITLALYPLTIPIFTTTQRHLMKLKNGEVKTDAA
jgi:hypothetical protein